MIDRRTNMADREVIYGLEDTVDLMINGENFKDRFKAEYYQLVIRFQKLTKMLDNWDNNRLDFEPDTPRGVYNLQVRAMSDYIAALEARAAIEGIELADVSA